MDSHPLDPHAVLNRPQYKSDTPDNKLRRKIATYFCDALGSPLSKILPLLPEVMPRWGKVLATFFAVHRQTGYESRACGCQGGQQENLALLGCAP
jgi:hypothetical protein